MNPQDNPIADFHPQHQPKAPRGEDERKRLEALESYRIMDTPAEESFDRITELVKDVCQTPIVLVTLLDENRQWFKSRQGINVCETPREVAFCNHTIRDDHLMEVEDALHDERFADNPLVLGEPYIRFYAGAPLITSGGHALGSLCAIDQKPRKLDDFQRRFLSRMADQVVEQMEFRLNKLYLEEKEKELAWYQNVVENSGELIMIIHHHTNAIERVNENFCRFLGHGEEELKGRNIYDFVYEEDMEYARSVGTQQACNEGRINSVRVRWYDGRGRARWLSWTGTYKNGYWFVCARDVTEQLETEARAQREAEHSVHILESVSDAYFSLTPDWEFTYINKQAEEVLQLPRKQLLGRNVWERFPEARGTRFEKAYAYVMEQREYTQFEEYFAPFDIWFHVSAYPDPIGGGILVFFRNINERKARENQLRTAHKRLLEAQQIAGLATFYLDRQRRSLEGNELFNHIVGLTHRGEIPLSTVMRRICPKDRRRLLRAYRQAMDTTDTQRLDLRLNNYSGKGIKYIFAVLEPEWDEEIQQWRLRGVLQDITERKQNEQAVEQARNEAVKAHQAKERFLSVMSHEMRTPLNAITGMSNLLLEGDPRPDQAEDLETLKFSADSLLNLVNDLLDHSKIEAGRLELHEQAFDLCKLVYQIGRSLQPKAEQKDLQLDWHVACPETCWVVGDANRLNQVLTNLLSNAIKFTKEGKVVVRVANNGAPSAEHVSLTFSVEDTGVGIPPDKLDLIFQNYTQVEKAHSQMGTGLGLNISQKLVSLMGGELKVESEPEVGSRFYFTLSMPVAQEVSPAPAPEGREQAPLRGARVLLVEDNPANRMVAQRYLHRWGAELEIARSGEELSKFDRRDRFDIILLDLNLPDTDGYTISANLRSRLGQGPAILALTASSAANDVETRARKAGMNAVLWKPFEPEAFLRALQQHYAPQAAGGEAPNQEGPPLPEGRDEANVAEHRTGQGIHIEQVEAIAEGDKQFIYELLHTFRSSLHDLVEKATEAVRTGTTQALDQARHQYKPSIEMLGEAPIQDLLYRTRALSQEDTDGAQRERLLEELSQEVRRIDQAITAYLQAR